MSIGKIETLVIEQIKTSVELLAMIPPENLINSFLVHGLAPEYPYLVVSSTSVNSGPYDALMLSGVLDIDVYFKQNTFEDVDTALGLLKTMFNGTILKDTGYFCQCFFHGTSLINLPETIQNVVAKKIRFQVRETY